MRTILLSVFVVCLADAVLAQSAPTGSPTSWYAQTIALNEKGRSQMAHFWSKGPLFRSEMVVQGRKIVTIVDRTTYYVIDEASGQGIAIERAEAARALDARSQRPFGNELEKLLREGGELIRSEQVRGQPADVYRLTNAQGRRTVWVSTSKLQVPLRIETYTREGATTGSVDYLLWAHNPMLADSFFAPNPRVRMKQLSYEEYRKESRRAPVGPAPVLYRHMLHGEG